MRIKRIKRRIRRSLSELVQVVERRGARSEERGARVGASETTSIDVEAGGQAMHER